MRGKTLLFILLSFVTLTSTFPVSGFAIPLKKSNKITGYIGAGDSCSSDAECDYGLLCSPDALLCESAGIAVGDTVIRDVSAEEKLHYEEAAANYDTQILIERMDAVVDFASNKGADVDVLESVIEDMKHISSEMRFAGENNDRDNFERTVKEVEILRGNFKEKSKDFSVIKENRVKLLEIMNNHTSDPDFVEMLEKERLQNTGSIMGKIFDRRMEEQEILIDGLEENDVDTSAFIDKFNDLKDRRDEFVDYAQSGDISNFNKVEDELLSLHRDIKTSAPNLKKDVRIERGIRKTTKLIGDALRHIDEVKKDIDFSETITELDEMKSLLDDADKARASGNFELGQTILDDIKDKYDSIKEDSEIKIRAEREKESLNDRINDFNEEYYSQKVAYDDLKEKFAELPAGVEVMDDIITEYRTLLDDAKTYTAGKEYDKALTIVEKLEAQKELFDTVVDNNLPYELGEKPKAIADLEEEFGSLTVENVKNMIVGGDDKFAEALRYSDTLLNEFVKEEPNVLADLMNDNSDFARELAEKHPTDVYDFTENNFEEVKDCFLVRDKEEFVERMAENSEVFDKLLESDIDTAKKLMGEKPFVIAKLGEKNPEKVKQIMEENKELIEGVMNKSDALLPFFRKNEAFAKEKMNFDVQLEDPEYVANLIKSDPEKAIELITQNARLTKRLIEHESDAAQEFFDTYKDSVKDVVESMADESEIEEFFKYRPALGQKFGRKFAKEMDINTMANLMVVNPEEVRNIAEKNPDMFKQVMERAEFKGVMKEFATAFESDFGNILTANAVKFKGAFGNEFKQFETKYMPDAFRAKECSADSDCSFIGCPSIECRNTPVCISGSCQCGASADKLQSCKTFKDDKMKEGRCSTASDCFAPSGATARCEGGFCTFVKNLNAMTACGDGICDRASYEGFIGCPADCPKANCGNGVCDDLDEDPWMCPADCKNKLTAGYCGDTLCDPWEDMMMCPADCKGKDTTGWECWGPNDCDASYGVGYCGAGKAPSCNRDHKCGCIDVTMSSNFACGNSVCEPEEGAGGSFPCFADCGCDIYKGANCIKNEWFMRNGQVDIAHFMGCDPASCKGKCGDKNTYCNQFNECVCEKEVKTCSADKDCSCSSPNEVPKCDTYSKFCFCDFVGGFKPVGGAYCGDKWCDEYESKNPQVCPMDCGGCDCSKLNCKSDNGEFCDPMTCSCMKNNWCALSAASCTSGQFFDPMTCSCISESANWCGNTKCEPGESGWCYEDCGSTGFCGDNRCDPGEEKICPNDCAASTCDCASLKCWEKGTYYCEPATCACVKSSTCGDGSCDAGEGSWCPADCGAQSAGCKSDSECAGFRCRANEKSKCDTAAGSCFCFMESGYCGDRICDQYEKSSSVCPGDCGVACTQQACASGEWFDYGLCKCMKSTSGWCGDAVCDSGEETWCFMDCKSSVTTGQMVCMPPCSTGYYCGAQGMCMKEGVMECAKGPIPTSGCKCSGLDYYSGYCCDGKWQDGPCGGYAGAKTCAEQNGKMCGSTANCKDGNWLQASDSMRCCSGWCDVSSSTTTGWCGDKVCSSYESPMSCPYDCGAGTTAKFCGDSVCDGTETKTNCPDDCGGGTGTQTCAAQSGITCASSDTCSDQWLPASDSMRCCKGTCQVSSGYCGDKICASGEAGWCFSDCATSTTATCGSKGGVCCTQGQRCTGWFDSAGISDCSSFCCRDGTCTSTAVTCANPSSYSDNTACANAGCHWCLASNSCVMDYSTCSGGATCATAPSYCSQSDCASHGWYWCTTSNTCVTGSGSCISGNVCSFSMPSYCTSQNACAGVGLYWCNNVCQGATCAGVGCSSPATYVTSTTCTGAGCYWCSSTNSCVIGSSGCTTATGCSSSNYAGCTSESSCTGIGGFWCNNACQASSCSSGTACSNPSQYITSTTCASGGCYWCTTSNTCIGSSSSCTAGNVCSASSPAYCTSQSACTGVGLYWCNNMCQASSCSSGTTCSNPAQYVTSPTCTGAGCYWCSSTNSCVIGSSGCTTATGCSSSNYAGCTSESSCTGIGGFWCNNVCQTTSCTVGNTCSASMPSYCTSESSCTGVGLYWCNNMCQMTACTAGNTCSASSPAYCTSQSACTGVGGFWCNNMCQATACTAYCGDGTCGSGEDSGSCPSDCGMSTCAGTGGTCCGDSQTCSGSWQTNVGDCSKCCIGTCQSSGGQSGCGSYMEQSGCTTHGCCWTNNYCGPC